MQLKLWNALNRKFKGTICTYHYNADAIMKSFQQFCEPELDKVRFAIP